MGELFLDFEEGEVAVCLAGRLGVGVLSHCCVAVMVFVFCFAGFCVCWVEPSGLLDVACDDGDFVGVVAG